MGFVKPHSPLGVVASDSLHKPLSSAPTLFAVRGEGSTSAEQTSHPHTGCSGQRALLQCVLRSHGRKSRTASKSQWKETLSNSEGALGQGRCAGGPTVLAKGQMAGPQPGPAAQTCELCPGGTPAWFRALAVLTFLIIVTRSPAFSFCTGPCKFCGRSCLHRSLEAGE